MHLDEALKNALEHAGGFLLSKKWLFQGLLEFFDQTLILIIIHVISEECILMLFQQRHHLSLSQLLLTDCGAQQLTRCEQSAVADALQLLSLDILHLDDYVGGALEHLTYVRGIKVIT
jgi:hypothetical protein